MLPCFLVQSVGFQVLLRLWFLLLVVLVIGIGRTTGIGWCFGLSLFLFVYQVCGLSWLSCYRWGAEFSVGVGFYNSFLAGHSSGVGLGCLSRRSVSLLQLWLIVFRISMFECSFTFGLLRAGCTGFYFLYAFFRVSFYFILSNLKCQILNTSLCRTLVKVV